MVAQETNLLNAFETTLSTTLGASGTTVTLTAVTDSASNNITAPCYLVIEPDSATNREYVLVSAINIGTKTITLGDGGSSYRYLTGSSATSGLSHASGATIRYVPMAQHIEDINDRVDTIINSAGTAVVTTGVVKDEDNMASDSATHLATQQSIKKYVDDKVTAEDLDVETDSGNIDIDLDSEALTIAGGEGIDTSATGTTVTIAGEDATTSNKGVASFSSDNFAVSSGSVTIKSGGVDLTAEVTGTLPVANGGTGATTLTDGGVLLGSGTGAITATAVLTNGQLLIGDGTGDPTVGTLTGTSPIGITNGAGSITIAASDATTSAKGVASFSSDNFAVSSGAVTIKTGGVDNDELAGSIANSKLSNSSITVSDGSSSTAISLGGTATFAAGEGLDVAESSGTVTFSGEDATTSNKGVASFSSDNFSVSSGAVTIKSGGVDLTAEVTGTLPTGNGGTGLSSFTAGDLVYYASGTTLTKLAKGAAGEVLTMNSGATAPEWASAAAGDITGVTITTASNSGLAGGDTASSGAFSATLTTDLNNLTAATVDVAADSIAIVDADASNGTRKESIADLVDAIDGTALSASSGVLNVSGITTSEIASGTLVDSSDTIASNNTDTTIPTSKAVKSYVDGQGFADIGLIIALG